MSKISQILNKAFERSCHPKPRFSSNGVLIYTAPGMGTLAECRAWAKSAGVNLIVINVATADVEAAIAQVVKVAEQDNNTVVLFDEYDRAKFTTRPTLLSTVCEAGYSNNILFCIATVGLENNLNDAERTKFTFAVRNVTKESRTDEALKEAIALESDLLLKLNPLSEAEIFEFMKNLRGGTYFNMGMYSSIPVSRAYKKTIRIYKVIDLTAIVSGVDYENIGTTKDFRDATGEGPGKSWYDHTPGFEHKVGQKKSDPSYKYVLWDIKKGSNTTVRYYVVDIDTGAVTPVSKEDVLQSDYLTPSEKKNLTPKPVVGIDLTTGQAVENKTNWRTAAFDHIFWLNQAGKSTQEYGVRFEEDLGLTEALGDELFMDAHAGVRTDLDAILSGEMVESVGKALEEDARLFMDAHAGVKTKLDDILSGEVTEDLEEETDKRFQEVRYDEMAFIDITGSGAQQKALEDAAKRDGFTGQLFYEANSLFKNVLKASDEVGDNGMVTLYTADNDHEYNCPELATRPNVKIKLIDNKLKESYRRTTSRGSSLVDNELFVDFD